MNRLAHPCGIALWIATAAALPGCEVSKRSEVCVAANDGKTMTVLGYVSAGGFSLVSSDDEFPVKIVESMNAEDHIRVSVKLGEGPNTMKPLPQDRRWVLDVRPAIAHRTLTTTKSRRENRT